jgi:FPC/CPF motif-containing protein YcgG
VTEPAARTPDEVILPEDSIVDALVTMVSHPSYPCLGAQSVLRQGRATVRVYDQLGTPATAQLLLQHLQKFAATVGHDDGFVSFIAIFREPRISDERHFEALLWSQLRQLNEADEEPWSDKVSPDPDDEHFAFSVAGTAYFVVGLHPMASRDARRSATPTLVFNLHEQFEALRASGKFPRMRDLIRDRDESLQGTVNPMVADHGASSEARQYSGREVGPGWRAPFDAEPRLRDSDHA